MLIQFLPLHSSFYETAAPGYNDPDESQLGDDDEAMEGVEDPIQDHDPSETPPKQEKVQSRCPPNTYAWLHVLSGEG